MKMTTLKDDERKSVEQMDQKEREKKSFCICVQKKEIQMVFLFLKKIIF